MRRSLARCFAAAAFCVLVHASAVMAQVSRAPATITSPPQSLADTIASKLGELELGRVALLTSGRPGNSPEVNDFERQINALSGMLDELANSRVDVGAARRYVIGVLDGRLASVLVAQRLQLVTRTSDATTGRDAQTEERQLRRRLAYLQSGGGQGRPGTRQP